MSTSTSSQFVLPRLEAQISFDSQHTYTQHGFYGSSGYVEETWRRDLRPMGQGAFGQVYREECISGGKVGGVRAVKEMEKPKMQVKINYSRELAAVAQFSQQRYNQWFTKSSCWFEHESKIFIVMECAKYGSLDKCLESSLPEKEVQVLMRQVLEGLSHMHRLKYAHRDLKPANLLVFHPGPQWHIKLADFGLSKRLTESTTARTEAGTLAFMAPEILGVADDDDDDSESDEHHRPKYDNSVDIWASGVVSFYLITGALPYFSQNVMDRRPLKKYYKGKTRFPTDVLVATGVSHSGCECIKWLLEPKSASRPKADDALKHAWITETASFTSQPIVHPSDTLLSATSASWTTKDSGYQTTGSADLRQPRSDPGLPILPRRRNLKIGEVDRASPTQSTLPGKQKTTRISSKARPLAPWEMVRSLEVFAESE